MKPWKAEVVQLNITFGALTFGGFPTKCTS